MKIILSLSYGITLASSLLFMIITAIELQAGFYEDSVFTALIGYFAFMGADQINNKRKSR